MTYTLKAFLTCNKCGATEESSVDYDDKLTHSFDNGINEGWRRIKQGHHLCPDCAKAYESIEEEMHERLDKAAGIRKIEIEI